MTETNLIRYDVARQALQAASTIDDAKQIKDKVEALRAYARQIQRYFPLLGRN